MSLSTKSLALAVLLTASTLLGACLASSDEGSDTVSDCEPEMPPNVDANATMVALQMHQWIWIENLTAPDWGPTTRHGGLFYEFLQPGVVVRKRLLLLSTMDTRLYSNVSYVTDGNTLCTAALTEYRNRTSGDPDSISCSRTCHTNFTTKGMQANAPLLVLDDWTKMSRMTEYLALDAVDPDSRAAYKCMGYFAHGQIFSMPSLLPRERQCLAGDECLFNYNTNYRLVSAGCKNDFRGDFSWCVSDLEICQYNMDGDCPVCCKGDYCNRALGQKVYQKWLENHAGSSAASSLAVLAASVAALSFFSLLK